MIAPKQMPGAEGAIGNVFGNASLGDVTLSVNTPNFTGGDFDSLTIAPGVTVTPPPNRSIRIRCRTLFHMGAGSTIDVSNSWQTFGVNPNPATVIQTGSFINAAPGGAGGGGGSASAEGEAGVTEGGGEGSGAAILGYTLPNTGNFGANGEGGGMNAPGGNGTDATPGAPGTVNPDFLAGVEVGGIDFVSSGSPGGSGLQGGTGGVGGFGGGPGNPGQGGAGGVGGIGGNGAGLLRIEAPTMQFDAGASLLANGGPGQPGGAASPGGAADAGSTAGGGGAGSGAGGGQGGGGGPILLRYQTMNGAPTTSVSGGAGGAGGAGALGGAGDGGAGAGGSSGAGALGPSGSTGFVASIQL